MSLVLGLYNEQAVVLLSWRWCIA